MLVIFTMDELFLGKGAKKKKVKKKLTSVSLMYVYVAENVELLFFFTFFCTFPQGCIFFPKIEFFINHYLGN